MNAPHSRMIPYMAQLAFAGGGWLGTLQRILGVASLLGIINGVFVDPLLRVIGYPPKDPQPFWFTILCAVAFLVVVALDFTIFSKGKES